MSRLKARGVRRLRTFGVPMNAPAATGKTTIFLAVDLADEHALARVTANLRAATAQAAR